MYFVECIKSVSTVLDLKRIASAYVIDYRKLSASELVVAMEKTAPQYYHKENVYNALNSLVVDNMRNNRVLSNIFIKEILLNKDGFTETQKNVDDEIIAYEQNIINLANEYVDKDPNSRHNLFRYILECAWDHEGTISVDEKNLIEKIRLRLKISTQEYEIIEAKIGKYPNEGNITHTRSEISETRKALQSKGLLFSVRDTNNVDYDVIPEEIVKIVREFYGIEIKSFAFTEILKSKYVKTKAYLQNILEKTQGYYDQYATVPQLQDEIMKKVRPSNVLGGFSPNDGLDKGKLSAWCTELELPAYGTKSELIDRILSYYDSKKQIAVDSADEREVYYKVYVELANRNLQFLRKQEICTKDIECERKFEDATNYLFEKILKHKPLMLKGTEHPDGILSFNDKLIMWDNKSKETDVNLFDHIKQFDRYIKSSQKPVAIFMVIAPNFTPQSVSECAKYALNNDALILLITADELKELADDWLKKHKTDEESFPLGYFKQNGRFDRKLVSI